jgi:hypothetical protein
MKKKLNTERIANELAGASLFFAPSNRAVKDTPLPEKPVSQEGRQKEEQKNSPTVPVPEPVGVRVGVRVGVPLTPKVKRIIKQRQPFDIYEDQYQRLKKIAEIEKEFVNGRGMSQMVREAIDNYLKDHASPKE